jgi:parallel beta-helix repeat protein
MAVTPPHLSKFLAILWIVCACGAFCLAPVASSAQGSQALVYYVATDGNDSWSGKLAAPSRDNKDGPFATITKARDAIRKLKAEGGLQRPVNVYIRGGTYNLSSPITFTPDDSGTDQCPISYQAYPGEKPVLCGGLRITGFRTWKGQIQEVFLPKVKTGRWYFRQLFVDDKRQIRARHPNFDPADPYRKGFSYVDKSRGGFGSSVGNIHNPGDWMEYEILVPGDGEYHFWVYYAAFNQPHGTTDMSGRTVITIDGGEPVALHSLPDTGDWNAFKWTKSATIPLSAGKHLLRWQNIRGGGLNLEAFALTDDPDWVPTGTDLPKPAEGKQVMVIQAENFVRSHGPQLSVSAGGGSKTEFRFRPGDILPSWAAAPDPEVHIFPSDCCRAFKEIVRLSEVDEENCLARVNGPECVALLRTGDRYFVENVPEVLDAPGEWYLDPRTGYLRLWATKSLAKAEVIAPVVGRVFQFEGSSDSAAPVRNITILGLTIKNTDYSPDDGCVGFGMGKDGVIYLHEAVGCRVENCDFLNIGKYAVCIVGGARNSVIGNNIAHGAEGGVLVLDSAGNTISDNYIHHCGEIYKHIGGVVLEGAGASDNVVSHNLIHTISRYGITLKNPGSRNVIEYNELYDLNTETYDTGGIEVTQHDPEFRSGSVIRNNIVHDVIGYSSDNGKPVFLSWGIYLDSYAGGYTVTDNIVYRNSHGGVMVQGGKDNRIENNIFVGSTVAQLLFANFRNNSTGNQFNRNIVYYTEPNAALIMAGSITPSVMTADYNVYFNATGGELRVRAPGMNALDDWRKLGLDTHSIVADPLFVNPDADNFALRPESPAFGLGFKAIDTSRVGLLRKRPRSK